MTARNGRRWSTAVGYLRPARRRGNLTVVANALTTRILFDGRRAVGVEYRRGETTHVARANVEVIVAGGAFNSPQLLQLSGLGPAEHLRSLGIDVVADMPGVGADLQDHPQVRMQYRCTEPITMNDVINSRRHRLAAGLRYLIWRKGLLTIGGAYAGGFFRSDPAVATPDVQLHMIIFSADTVGAALHPFPGFIVSVCVLRPQSRGHVRIKSADPREAPAIQPRYLSAPEDRAVMVRGMKLLRHVMAQKAIRRYIAEERAPGDAVPERRRAPRLRARGLHHGVPSGQHLPHGQRRHRGGRRAAARARHRAPARGRRLGHAEPRLRQHQRGNRHDRREGRRHDPRGCAGEREHREGCGYTTFAISRSLSLQISPPRRRPV